MNRSILVATLVGLAWLGLAGSASALIDPWSPSDASWWGVSYPGVEPDYPDDHQTGIADSDIVGDAGHPGFYIRFDDGGTPDPTDGWIGYRVRLGADTSPPGFNHFLGVGMDVDDDGSLDFFLGVDNSGSTDEIGIWAAGGGLNTSPNTTTLSNTPLWSVTSSATDYSWMIVDGTSDPNGIDVDLDDDLNDDYFLTFIVPLTELVTAVGGGFDQNSLVHYVIGTSNQSNALNNDLGGADDKNIDKNDDWATIGALSKEIRVVPEPAGALLLGLALVALMAARRRR